MLKQENNYEYYFKKQIFKNYAYFFSVTPIDCYYLTLGDMQNRYFILGTKTGTSTTNG